jgi:hypothetical protein
LLIFYLRHQKRLEGEQSKNGFTGLLLGDSCDGLGFEYRLGQASFGKHAG